MRFSKRFTVFVGIALIGAVSVVVDAQQPLQGTGTLIVRVFIGDNNSPSRGAFVYVRGYRRPVYKEESVIPDKVREGWFELSLQPGLYDVFISEGSSLPMCRRVEIHAGKTKFYTAKLEADEDHLEN